MLSGPEIVRSFLLKKGLQVELVDLPEESAMTSASAASALGCTVAEIAKSIAFTDSPSPPPPANSSVIVVLSGDRRVNTDLLKVKMSWRSARLMSPSEVLEATGYRIGGVPPFPHREGIKVMVDMSLKRFPTSWAAAGSASSVMRITPELLTDCMRYVTVDVSGSATK